MKTLLRQQDHIAMMTTGQEIADLPKLNTVPYGYYLHRDGKRVARLQADHTFIPFHAARGLKFLSYEKDHTLEEVEALVYLQAMGGIPVKKTRKRKKKGGK